MIKYYETEAAYAADAKSSFESQISLVGESNEVHFDGRNVIVGIKTARTGSVAVLDGNSALHFVAPGTFNSASFMSNYTVVGVVVIGVDHPDYRGKVVILRKTFGSKVWSYIYSFKLTGYTLDGTDRTGVLSIREASAWGTAVDYTVSYNASDIDGLVTQLNAFFRDTTNTVFQTQDWQAVKSGDEVHLVFHLIDYRQASNTGKSGFTLTANLLPGIPASSAMLRMNGQRSGEGTITNWDKAIAYFSADLNNATYNPTSAVTSPKRGYPICKPGYLGTSQYSGGDQCAALRAIYGDGEEGWKKFMASFLPVRPTEYGPVGDKETYGDSKRNTGIMGPQTFTKQDGTVVDAFPAAADCYNTTFSHEAMGKGSWVLPDMDTVFSIMKMIHYGTNPSKQSDPINAALAAIGGSALANSSYVWSSSRCLASTAWCSIGAYGFAVGYNMSGSNLALPLLLLDVA